MYTYEIYFILFFNRLIFDGDTESEIGFSRSTCIVFELYN